MIPMTNDGLNRLHRIVGHLMAAATEIDELGPNAADWGIVSIDLASRQGVTMFKLRDCCDELNRIEQDERRRAEEWDRLHGIS
jgi:hypothetical protein